MWRLRPVICNSDGRSGRVGIVDFDVHHGNGTQHIFEDDPNVFYYSIHEHPSFRIRALGANLREAQGRGWERLLIPLSFPDKAMMNISPRYSGTWSRLLRIPAGSDYCLCGF